MPVTMVFLAILGTRETAFVHAISAAGVAHAVTRACSKGDLQQCGCDRTVSGRSSDGFEWSGCSDNIEFGTGFSRKFVDARERKRKKKTIERYLMNIHNNEAGRKVSDLFIYHCFTLQLNQSYDFHLMHPHQNI